MDVKITECGVSIKNCDACKENHDDINWYYHNLAERDVFTCPVTGVIVYISDRGSPVFDSPRRE